jgi:hypothetical protein
MTTKQKYSTLDDNVKVAMGRKNLLINGDFSVWQRGSEYALVDQEYRADRWFFGECGLSISDTAPLGQNYSAYITTTSSGGIPALRQGIELVREGHAGIFYIGSTFTFSGYYQGEAGSDVRLLGQFRDTVGSTANQIGVVDAIIGTIAATDVWEKFTHTFTISSSPSSNNKLLELLQTTSTSSSVSRFSSMQLEKGSVATEFEYVNVADQLARCQRYYRRYSGNSSDSLSFIGGTSTTTTVQFFGDILGMRDIPQLSFTNLTASTYGGSNSNMFNLNLVSSTKDSFRITSDIAGSFAVDTPLFVRVRSGLSGFLAFDSEL